jgi:general secretion pathway protein N
VNAADRRRLTPSLGILAAALLLVLIALWLGLGRGAHWHDKAAPPKLPQAGTNLPAPTVPPLEQYAAVWQHPLFSPSRTPEAPAGNGDEATGDLQLTGVIMLPDLKLAILHDKTQNKDYRAILGRPSRDAPALIELHPRSAVVDASGTRLTLQLVPGAAPDAGNAQADDPQPAPSAERGGSGMVSPPGDDASGRQTAISAGRASAAARASQLKLRIQAARQRAEQQNGGGD